MMPYYGMGMFYDPTMMILIPAILFTMYAQYHQLQIDFLE